MQLTSSTNNALIPTETRASVTIDSVSAGTSMLTRVADTIVGVWNENIKKRKLASLILSILLSNLARMILESTIESRLDESQNISVRISLVVSLKDNDRVPPLSFWYKVK